MCMIVNLVDSTVINALLKINKYFAKFVIMGEYQ